MRKGRWGVAGLAAALTLGAGPAEAAVPPAAWQDCFEPPLQCARVTVPVDYDQPGGVKIPIAMVRAPATDPSRRIGSLFLNPGGPGGSGVGFLAALHPFLFTEEVRARFDLVGFDPRGIGGSAPLRCFANESEARQSFALMAYPTTAAEENRWRLADEHLASACGRRAPLLASHMSTANVARDMDRMRQAVGDAKLNYYGISYGSFLGATYAMLFPNGFRSLVVDAILDPIAWTTGTSRDRHLPFSTRLRSDLGAGATLDEFFRLCDAGGERCAFSGNAKARYGALLERFRQDPYLRFDDGTKVMFRMSDLVAITLGAMFAPDTWPSLAEFLADLEAVALPAALRKRVSMLRARAATKAGWYPVRERLPYPNYVDGFPAVACSDTNNPDGFDAWRRAARGSRTTFGPLWTWITSVCDVWPFQDEDRYLGPWTKRTAAPVLLANTLFDPATRYEGAQTLHALLPNSRLLTVNGWGHATLFTSRCADSAIERYLVTGDAPATQECDPDVVPFQD